MHTDWGSIPEWHQLEASESKLHRLLLMYVQPQGHLPLVHGNLSVGASTYYPLYGMCSAE